MFILDKFLVYSGGLGEAHKVRELSTVQKKEKKKKRRRKRRKWLRDIET